MARFRAVVTDLDGTIVRADGTVTAATVRAAAELSARGIPLILATARTPAGVRALDALAPHVAVAVCCGGALGWSPATQRVLWRETIAAAAVGELVRFATARFPGAGIAAYDGRRWAMTEAYPAARGAVPLGPCDVLPAADIAACEVCTMAIGHPDLGVTELVAGLVAGRLDAATHLTYALPNLVDITPAGIDKRSGVSRALELLGIAPSDAVAFGDMPNDLPMFGLCGHPVAVGNAHPDVLAAAASVAHSVDEDGFARTLADLGVIGASRPGQNWRVSALIQAYIRRTASAGRETDRVGPFLVTVTPHNANLYLNYAVPDEGARPSDADVAALVAAFERRERTPRLEYLPALAPDVEPALLRAGFTVEGRLPVMMCRPGDAIPQPEPPGFEFGVPDTDAARYDTAAVQRGAFGETGQPGDHDVARLRGLLDGGGLAVLVREAATGRPAGAGLCDRMSGGVGELVGIAVSDPFRRRGLGAAITSWLTRRAHEAGATEPFLTPAGESQERIYARVGYRTVDHILHIARGRG